MYLTSNSNICICTKCSEVINAYNQNILLSFHSHIVHCRVQKLKYLAIENSMNKVEVIVDGIKTVRSSVFIQHSNLHITQKTNSSTNSLNTKLWL